MANLDYKELKQDSEKLVYVIQEIPGTKEGRPKINIMGAQKFGKIKVLLKEDSQMIFSPGPIIFEPGLILECLPRYRGPLISEPISTKLYSSKIIGPSEASKTTRKNVLSHFD